MVQAGCRGLDAAQGIAHPGARRAELIGRPIAGGGSADFQGRRGFGDIRQRPIGPPNAVVLHEIQPTPRFGGVDHAAAGVFAETAFGDHQGNAVFQSRDGFVTQELLMRRGVIVERVDDIGAAGDGVFRGFIHFLRPASRAAKNQIIGVDGAYGLDDFLVIRLNHRGPGMFIGRLIPSLINDVGKLSVGLGDFGEEFLGQGKAFIGIAGFMPIDNHVNAIVDGGLNHRLGLAHFFGGLGVISLGRHRDGRPDHGAFPIVDQPFDALGIVKGRHPLAPVNRHAIEGDGIVVLIQDAIALHLQLAVGRDDIALGLGEAG